MPVHMPLLWGTGSCYVVAAARITVREEMFVAVWLPALHQQSRTILYPHQQSPRVSFDSEPERQSSSVFIMASLCSLAPGPRDGDVARGQLAFSGKYLLQNSGTHEGNARRLDLRGLGALYPERTRAESGQEAATSHGLGAGVNTREEHYQAWYPELRHIAHTVVATAAAEFGSE
ncbi:hypothetical protein C8R47DRAFT_1197289 [Mycena vitilis]|nr:hypothetical protein C8R47DRAFT_1197289 [Mycena vitilis]